MTCYTIIYYNIVKHYMIKYYMFAEGGPPHHRRPAQRVADQGQGTRVRIPSLISICPMGSDFMKASGN